MKKYSLKQKIIIFFFLLIAGELVCCVNNMIFEYKEKMLVIPYTCRVRPFEQTYQEVYKYGFGKVYGEKYNKKPIAIFGESCAFGDGIDPKQSFSSKLSDYTKRTVYNRAFSGWSIQNIYYQFLQDSFYKEVQEPEYVIVMFTPFSFRYMYDPDRFNSLKYDMISPNELKRVPLKVMQLNNSYLIAKINNWIGYKRAEKFDKSFDNYALFLTESKKLADNHWKNTKWVVLKYTDCFDSDNVKKWDKLSKKGFIIIDTTDLIGENFSTNPEYSLSKHNGHPTGKLWDDLVPKLSQKLKI